MFANSAGKGFKMTFANGWTASVQFGPGNYCDNRYTAEPQRARFAEDYTCNTAEIAAWDQAGAWYRGPDWNDDVHGHQTVEEVMVFLNAIQRL